MRFKHCGFHCSHNHIQLWTPWFYFSASNWYLSPYWDAYEIGTILTFSKYMAVDDICSIWNTMHYVTGKQIVENRWNLSSKGA